MDTWSTYRIYNEIKFYIFKTINSLNLIVALLWSILIWFYIAFNYPLINNSLISALWIKLELPKWLSVMINFIIYSIILFISVVSFIKYLDRTRSKYSNKILFIPFLSVSEFNNNWFLDFEKKDIIKNIYNYSYKIDWIIYKEIWVFSDLNIIEYWDRFLLPRKDSILYYKERYNLKNLVWLDFNIDGSLYLTSYNYEVFLKNINYYLSSMSSIDFNIISFSIKQYTLWSIVMNIPKKGLYSLWKEDIDIIGLIKDEMTALTNNKNYNYVFYVYMLIYTTLYEYLIPFKSNLQKDIADDNIEGKYNLKDYLNKEWLKYFIDIFYIKFNQDFNDIKDNIEDSKYSNIIHIYWYSLFVYTVIYWLDDIYDYLDDFIDKIVLLIDMSYNNKIEIDIIWRYWLFYFSLKDNFDKLRLKDKFKFIYNYNTEEILRFIMIKKWGLSFMILLNDLGILDKQKHSFLYKVIKDFYYTKNNIMNGMFHIENNYKNLTNKEWSVIYRELEKIIF